MRFVARLLCLLPVVALGLPPTAGAADDRRPALEPIRLSADGLGFVVGRSATRFRIWGVNYDHDARGEGGRLLEDYWEDEWETVRQDFGEIRDLGANVVRIHLQLGKFMTSPDDANPAALARLGRLLQLAEETRLRLDLTGLGCYHKADVPPWYDRLEEADRWTVQANFWRAIARTCRGSPAVFCYDLMNEPIIGGKVAEGWLAGELGGKHFVQRLTLEPRGRTAQAIAAAWAEKLTRAIRQEDPDHLITVGAIPWALVWPAAKPVFYAPEVARHFDFVSVHVYPERGKIDAALAALRVYAIGKPLVIEEVFPLKCGVAELEDFIRRSQEIADGWISFYWGRTIAEYEAARAPTLAEALTAQWLKHFRDLAPQLREP